MNDKPVEAESEDHTSPQTKIPEQLVEEAKRSTGAVSWMTRNSIAANLFMFVLLFGGFLGIVRSKQEVLPEFDVDIISLVIYNILIKHE